ncbi:MAG: signal recognition particle-docking protein FtsY [Alphaproteobacteria bacterium]
MKWFERLKKGLGRSAERLSGGLGGLFAGRKRCDQALLDSLEEVLIEADLGPKMAQNLIAELSAQKFNKDVDAAEIKHLFSQEIAKQLEGVAANFPEKTTPDGQPTVILVVGVNGSGKTTTIGKLANHFKTQGQSVMLAAGDTFRAAAVEQLSIWGARNDIPVLTAKPNSDAAALAYDAMDQAIAQNHDFLIMDTAGRLHNRDDLMQELVKITRIMDKKSQGAPHHVLLILDATTGQNALAQIDAFKKLTHLTGLIMTKLDGTAKGGVLVALAREFKLPVHAIGVGEQIEDLQPFDPKEFAQALVGLE